ncbi:MAG: hypothetical protein JWQ61_44 [Collimonas fungivorans]|nr:hypothetical protein [Collimonas fungivorans]MDB5765230.1 hypothetical protein [Collimonas fungivorans]
MRLLFPLITSLLLAACGHVTSPSGESGTTITPYGVIDTGVTRTNR